MYYRCPFVRRLLFDEFDKTLDVIVANLIEDFAERHREGEENWELGLGLSVRLFSVESKEDQEL
jgi:hypothetical protein